MNKIIKSLLKENNGCYYEFRPFYDSLPDSLEVPEYRTEIFPKTMTHKEIIETYNIVPYVNINDAFAVIADCIPTLKNDYKGRIAYFNDADGTLCRLDVWRSGGGGLRLYVNGVLLDDEWNDGYGVLASNNETKILEIRHDSLNLENFGTFSEKFLSEKDAIDFLSQRGYRTLNLTRKWKIRNKKGLSDD